MSNVHLLNQHLLVEVPEPASRQVKLIVILLHWDVGIGELLVSEIDGGIYKSCSWLRWLAVESSA